MEYIAHRINSLSELKGIPGKYGVEIDLRDALDGNIHIAHDPFVKGESFETYLKHYEHGTIILNIKSERIEFKVLELIKKYGITKYFFLDSSFPMIQTLASIGEKNVALRYSEFEGIDTLKAMQGKVNWIWIDCFTKLPMDHELFLQFKKMKYKLCLVSPELQGRDTDIEKYKTYLREQEIVFDAICTKHYNVSRWQ
ncbi:hypothetical protein [Maribacter aestuarii]|uniref:hypothetical protein n=1 Tax=Maribacter aestuarii TaxID=1130723 RepID=UPI00248D0D76|nr:hypothetical protein [Maribacter aestuarii]